MVGAAVVLFLAGSTSNVLWLVVAVPMVVVLVSEQTWRVAVGEDEIRILRPPLPTKVVPARTIVRIEQQTDCQMLVFVQRRRLPLNIKFLGVNSAEVESAILRLAERHKIRVGQNAIYREVNDSD